jgi:hypothetical protein
MRLMQHDAERAIVAGVSILVMMGFQPEGEGRQQQYEGEGKAPEQPLIRGRSGQNAAGSHRINVKASNPKLN